MMNKVAMMQDIGSLREVVNLEMQYSDLGCAFFSRVRFTGITFRGEDLEAGLLRNNNVDRYFTRCEFVNCRFIDCSLSLTDFTMCTFIDCSMAAAVRLPRFYSCQIIRSRFELCSGGEFNSCIFTNPAFVLNRGRWEFDRCTILSATEMSWLRTETSLAFYNPTIRDTDHIHSLDVGGNSLQWFDRNYITMDGLVTTLDKLAAKEVPEYLDDFGAWWDSHGALVSEEVTSSAPKPLSDIDSAQFNHLRRLAMEQGSV